MHLARDYKILFRLFAISVTSFAATKFCCATLVGSRLRKNASTVSMAFDFSKGERHEIGQECSFAAIQTLVSRPYDFTMAIARGDKISCRDLEALTRSMSRSRVPDCVLIASCLPLPRFVHRTLTAMLLRQVESGSERDADSSPLRICRRSLAHGTARHSHAFVIAQSSARTSGSLRRHVNMIARVKKRSGTSINRARFLKSAFPSIALSGTRSRYGG